MSTNLHGETVDYDGGTSSVFPSVVTKRAVALGDQLAPAEPVDLQLGATGKISFAVGGYDAIQMKEKVPGIDRTPVLIANRTDGGPQLPLEIRSTEGFGRVVVGGIETREVVGLNTNYLTSIHQDFMEIETSNLTITGSAHCEGDLLVNGNTIGKTMNVLRDFSQGTERKVGFGFRINDQEELVLYKYDSAHPDTGVGVTRTVNVFGQGMSSSSMSDPATEYPIYRSNNLVENNTLTVEGISGGYQGPWQSNVDNNHVYYTGGFVGIQKTDPLSPLDVNGDIRGLRFLTPTGLELVGNTIQGVSFLDASSATFREATIDNELLVGPVQCFGGAITGIITLSAQDVMVSATGNAANDDFTNLRDLILANEPTQTDDFLVRQTLTVQGQIGLSGATITSDLIADISGRNIGSAGTPWGALHLSDVLTGVSTLTAENVMVSATGDAANADFTNVRDLIVANEPTQTDDFLVRQTLTVEGQIDLSGATVVSDLIPDASGTRDLGSESVPWRQLYLSGDTKMSNGVITGVTLLSAENVMVSATGNAANDDFTGILDLLIANKPQSSDDITINSLAVLTEVDLSGASIVSDLVPDASRNLGSASAPWESVHLSETGIYLGEQHITSDASGVHFPATGIYLGPERMHYDISEQEIVLSSSSLNINGYIIDPSDPTRSHVPNFPPITSALNGEVLVSQEQTLVFRNISHGGDLGDFTRVSGGEATSNFTEHLRGAMSFGNRFDWTRYGYAYEVRRFLSTDVIPPDEFGEAVDVADTELIQVGPDNQDIQINFITADGSPLGDLAYVLPQGSTNFAEFFPLANLNPGSTRFFTKAKADFDFYFNDRLDANAEPMTSEFLLDGYVNLPAKSLHLDGTKLYTVEFLVIREAPLYSAATGSEFRYQTLLATTASARVTNHYQLNTTTDTYDNVAETLYPYIGYKKWENSIVHATFTDTLYYPDLGWGSPAPTAEAVYAKFDANDWLFDLFKVTYLSIQYASALAVPLESDTMWTQHIVVPKDDVNSYYKQFVTDVVGHNLVFTSVVLAGRTTIHKVHLASAVFTNAFV